MSVKSHRAIGEDEALRGEMKAVLAEIDDDTLRDTLEGSSGLPKALTAVTRASMEDLSLAAALGVRIADMQERLARFETRAEKKRALVTRIMGRAELKELQEPDFTVSLRAVPPRLVVSDEASIPADDLKPQPPELDRNRRLASLKAGEAIPG